MKIEIEIEQSELLPEILGSAYTTWSWWQEEKYDEGYSWDTFPEDNDLPFLTLGMTDPDDEEEERVIVKKLSVNDIAKGFARSGTGTWKNHDAISGDWIMQCAFFDSSEAIYA